MLIITTLEKERGIDIGGGVLNSHHSGKSMGVPL